MTSIVVQVSASNDDAIENRSNGSVARTGNIEISSTYNPAGVRFQNVTIPKNATIDSATLNVYVNSASVDEPNLYIYGQAADNAGEFINATNDISSRPKTTAKTTWYVASPGTGAGSKTSPDIKGVIQEIVNRAGWTSGNALVLIFVDISGSNFRFRSWDTDAATAAKLTVNYTVSGGGGDPDPGLPDPPAYLVRERGSRRLAIQVYANSDMATMLGDYTTTARGVRLATNPNGFSVLTTGVIEMSLPDAFTAYTWPGTPHVVVTAIDSGVVWEGRVEDVGIVPGGLRLTAFGYQNAMRDLLYTGFWMRLGTADWRAVTSAERIQNRPEQYEMDNNNRLYIAPRKGESYGTSYTNVGELTYIVPDKGAEPVRRIYATYEVKLPTGWEARLLSVTADFSTHTAEATVVGDGTKKTGTWSFNLTDARPRLIFSVSNNSGGVTTITNDTGVYYAKLTNLGVRSTTYVTPRPPVAASDIVASLVGYVNAANPKHLSSETARISTTSTVMQDANYEDKRPADILAELALQHGYQWAVWEDRILEFAPVPTVDTLGVRSWVVDAESDMVVERSLAGVYTNVYASYDSQYDGTLRTNEAVATAVAELIQLKRQQVLSVQTQDATQAAAFRDAALGDWSQRRARVQINFRRVFDSGGGQGRLYQMRSGDIVTIRNLPPTLSEDVDGLRTFVIGETVYDVDAGTMSISPATPTPTLEKMIARREAGLR